MQDQYQSEPIIIIKGRMKSILAPKRPQAEYIIKTSANKYKGVTGESK